MGISLAKILSQELERIRVNDDEIEYLENFSQLVANELERRMKKREIIADVFLGGSLAKGTMIRKANYDVDLFVRFSKKYTEEQIRKFMRKIFFWFRVPGQRVKKKRVHGSRDYYHITIKSRKGFSFEVVPTVKVSDPNEARNLTDLSYFHVEYIGKKALKNKKLVDEILLAKSFCHAQKCYGAESYIRGFSGYSIELLVSHYKTFRKFLFEMVKVDDQLILDPAKLYKNKKEIKEALSKAKLQSPVVLIDPTFKERNASNALSHETFKKFQVKAKAFLKEPDHKFFEYKRVDIPYFRTTAQEIKGIFAIFELRTKKQAGDIAGSKMLKFSKLLTRELDRYFDVVEFEYDYWGEKKSEVYYALKRKAEIIHVGPNIHHKEAVKAFKAKHRIWYEEEGRVKSATPTDLSIKEFLKQFNKKNKKTIKQMQIKKVRII
jgi:tRNA CCA-adding enzyme